jgi:hypothetical protein
LDIQSYQSISDLPTVVYQQIKTADAETLPRWSECVLTARTRRGEQTARFDPLFSIEVFGNGRLHQPVWRTIAGLAEALEA